MSNRQYDPPDWQDHVGEHEIEKESEDYDLETKAISTSSAKRRVSKTRSYQIPGAYQNSGDTKIRVDISRLIIVKVGTFFILNTFWIIIWLFIWNRIKNAYSLEFCSTPFFIGVAVIAILALRTK